MKKYLYLLFALVLFTGQSCKETVDFEKEKTSALDSFNQFIIALQDENAAILDDLLCDDPDMIFFGTDAQERWIGKDEFIAAQQAFFDATSDSKLEIYKSTIKLNKTGDVAWTSCMVNWDIISGDQSMRLEGLRMTCVLENRDGTWVVVQGHGSVPVSGQMIEY
jgi:hypothetical protein